MIATRIGGSCKRPASTARERGRSLDYAERAILERGEPGSVPGCFIRPSQYTSRNIARRCACVVAKPCPGEAMGRQSSPGACRDAPPVALTEIRKTSTHHGVRVGRGEGCRQPSQARRRLRVRDVGVPRHVRGRVAGRPGAARRGAHCPSRDGGGDAARENGDGAWITPSGQSCSEVSRAPSPVA